MHEEKGELKAKEAWTSLIKTHDATDSKLPEVRVGACSPLHPQGVGQCLALKHKLVNVKNYSYSDLYNYLASFTCRVLYP